jgi:hypothetical protein
MTQAKFKFGSPGKNVWKFAPERYKGADPKASWASVVLAAPGKYGPFVELLAKKALDRANRMSS